MRLLPASLLLLLIMGLAYATTCISCDTLSKASAANLVLIKDDGNKTVTVNAYFTNTSAPNPRVPINDTVIIIELSNSTGLKKIYKIFTDENGKATFDFTQWQHGCVNFRVLYCPFCNPGSPACGFAECLNYSRISQLPGAYQNALSGINSTADIEVGPGPSGNAPGTFNPELFLPELDQVPYCPPPPPLGTTPALCLPVLIIFSLLSGALYLTGKNPFVGFNVGGARIGKHIRYQARGRGFSFSIMQAVQAGMSIGTAAKTMAKGVEVTGKDGQKKVIKGFAALSHTEMQALRSRGPLSGIDQARAAAKGGGQQGTTLRGGTAPGSGFQSGGAMVSSFDLLRKGGSGQQYTGAAALGIGLLRGIGVMLINGTILGRVVNQVYTLGAGVTWGSYDSTTGMGRSLVEALFINHNARAQAAALAADSQLVRENGVVVGIRVRVGEGDSARETVLRDLSFTGTDGRPLRFDALNGDGVPCTRRDDGTLVPVGGAYLISAAIPSRNSADGQMRVTLNNEGVVVSTSVLRANAVPGTTSNPTGMGMVVTTADGVHVYNVSSVAVGPNGAPLIAIGPQGVSPVPVAGIVDGHAVDGQNRTIFSDGHGGYMTVSVAGPSGTAISGVTVTGVNAEGQPLGADHRPIFVDQQGHVVDVARMDGQGRPLDTSGHVIAGATVATVTATNTQGQPAQITGALTPAAVASIRPGNLLDGSGQPIYLDQQGHPAATVATRPDGTTLTANGQPIQITGRDGDGHPIGPGGFTIILDGQGNVVDRPYRDPQGRVFDGSGHQIENWQFAGTGHVDGAGHAVQPLTAANLDAQGRIVLPQGNPIDPSTLGTGQIIQPTDSRYRDLTQIPNTSFAELTPGYKADYFREAVTGAAAAYSQTMSSMSQELDSDRRIRTESIVSQFDQHPEAREQVVSYRYDRATEVLASATGVRTDDLRTGGHSDFYEGVQPGTSNYGQLGRPEVLVGTIAGVNSEHPVDPRLASQAAISGSGIDPNSTDGRILAQYLPQILSTTSPTQWAHMDQAHLRSELVAAGVPGPDADRISNAAGAGTFTAITQPATAYLDGLRAAVPPALYDRLSNADVSQHQQIVATSALMRDENVGQIAGDPRFFNNYQVPESMRQEGRELGYLDRTMAMAGTASSYLSQGNISAGAGIASQALGANYDYMEAAMVNAAQRGGVFNQARGEGEPPNPYGNEYGTATDALDRGLRGQQLQDSFQGGDRRDEIMRRAADGDLGTASAMASQGYQQYDDLVRAYDTRIAQAQREEQERLQQIQARGGSVLGELDRVYGAPAGPGREAPGTPAAGSVGDLVLAREAAVRTRDNYGATMDYLGQHRGQDLCIDITRQMGGDAGANDATRASGAADREIRTLRDERYEYMINAKDSLFLRTPQQPRGEEPPPRSPLTPDTPTGI